MGLGGWIPWLIIGGLLIGGFLLLRGTATALMNPDVQKTIHAVTSTEFKGIIQDKVAGKITDEQAQSRLKALADKRVNMARSLYGGYY